MKKVITIIAIVLGFTSMSQAQDKMMAQAAVSTISLEQTPGEFTQKQMTIDAGTYVFEVTNNNVGVDVGFVLIAAGSDASNPENHIKEAYVTSVVKNNSTETSKQVTLTKGTYSYFCPLNKTPQYTLIVQ